MWSFSNCVLSATVAVLFFVTDAIALPSVIIADLDEIDPSGEVDSSPGISHAISDGRRKLVFPCGVFLIEQVVKLPSHTEIEGAGPCTVFKLSNTIRGNDAWANMPMTHPPKTMPGSIFTNSDFLHGNEGITIRDLVLDGTSGTGGRTLVHLLAFYKTTKVAIERVTFLGNGTPDIEDGVAFIASSDYRVANNYVFNVWNACFDQWDGSHDFRIEHNVCDGNGKAGGGIFINGLNSLHTQNLTYNGSILSNIVVRVKNAGIYAGGLWNESKTSPVYGVVHHIRIEKNVVSDVSTFHGIIISDAHDVTAISNKVAHVARQGIRVGSQFQGITSNITITDNSVEDVDRTPVPDDAIRITNGASNVTIAGNTVGAGRHRCAIGIDANVSDARVFTEAGFLDPGSTGVVCDRRTAEGLSQYPKTP